MTFTLRRKLPTTAVSYPDWPGLSLGLPCDLSVWAAEYPGSPFMADVTWR